MYRKITTVLTLAALVFVGGCASDDGEKPRTVEEISTTVNMKELEQILRFPRTGEPQGVEKELLEQSSPETIRHLYELYAETPYSSSQMEYFYMLLIILKSRPDYTAFHDQLVEFLDKRIAVRDAETTDAIQLFYEGKLRSHSPDHDLISIQMAKLALSGFSRIRAIEVLLMTGCPAKQLEPLFDALEMPDQDKLQQFTTQLRGLAPDRAAKYSKFADYVDAKIKARHRRRVR